MRPHTHPEPARPPKKTLTSGVHAAIKKAKTPPPVLASDVLREDLAPTEPGRRASRIWDAGVAAAFLGVGICLRLHLGVTGVSPEAAPVCFAAAAATGVTAIVPFPYLWRAIVAAVVGLVVVVIGLAAGGPLALLAGGGPWGGWRLIAAIAMPAALLFRAYYRAYERGRVLLAGAFLLSVPFLVQEGALALDATHRLVQLGGVLTMMAMLSSLFALLGAPTTAATAWCAEFLTVISALDLGLRQFSAAPVEGMGPYAYLLTAVAFVASASPIALGLFQVLAAVHATDARKIDIHRPSAPSAPVIRDSSD